MSPAQIAFAVSAAVTVQTTLAWSVRGTAANLDLPLVVVVLVALSRGPLTGLWTGTGAGLAQDVLSGGIVGVSGLCKSVVGVAAGAAGENLLVIAAWQRGLVLVAATLVHAACFFGTYALIPATTPIGEWPDVTLQAVANALAGLVAIWVTVRLRGWRGRARSGRVNWTVGRWRARQMP